MPFVKILKLVAVLTLLLPSYLLIKPKIDNRTNIRQLAFEVYNKRERKSAIGINSPLAKKSKKLPDTPHTISSALNMTDKEQALHKKNYPTRLSACK